MEIENRQERLSKEGKLRLPPFAFTYTPLALSPSLFHLPDPSLSQASFLFDSSTIPGGSRTSLPTSPL